LDALQLRELIAVAVKHQLLCQYRNGLLWRLKLFIDMCVCHHQMLMSLTFLMHSYERRQVMYVH